ncbi:enoyl-CoA delta isomerase 1, mitochondrial-like isoform X2 [Acanthaster planci]|nr:enoyl-CoA delta isomerase 1, mitochondrial-like isoform X2 [Acanthaster planci]XP_022092709.1 enoyl-CoA delta isomerase 1, mitochondrial-like isoform X2 [Acanthaster planci]
MNKKPVNSMCGDFMRELSVTLEKLRNNETYRGAILTSAKPGIFSAGLDINEMYQRSTDHISVFWRTIHEFWLGLYGTDLAMVAAINGHAPAGGCLMALSCDYRIMSQGDYIIGLNETQLGILPPFWLQELMARACGDREAEMGLQLGTLYTPEEALKIGLVDEVAPLDSVVDRAREQVIKWLKIPDYARVVTKGMQRGPLLKKLQASQEEEVAFNAEFIHRESTQDVIEKYLMSLKKKKKKVDGQ